MTSPPLPTGLSVALVTPMTAEAALDLPTLRRHVERLVQEGVDVLMPCGTTGEGATLAPDEQRRVVAACVEAAHGQAPVFAGAGPSGTAQARELARAVREEGAQGLLCVTPAYNKPSQEGLYQHFIQVAEAGEGLPVILYNVPGRTAVNLLPETVLRLAEEEPVVGVKEASGDLDQIMTLIRERPEGFLVLAGDDALALPVIALGGDGVVSVVANEAPALMSRLVRAALEGRLDEARSVHFRLLPLMRANFVETNPTPVKAALHLMGRMAPHVRLPLVPPGPDSLEVIREALEEAGLLEGPP